MAVGDLTARMTEYVVLHVLMHHRQEPYLRTCQREQRWAPRSFNGRRVRFQSASWASARSGPTPPRRSPHLGFRVAGWSRSEKRIEGVACFHGTAGLDPFLRRTDILVCLLPLTSDTRYILDRGLFAKLNRTGALGAPVLINAGRGGLQNEADMLQCLDDGTLGAASLDVFASEPLPADSPFWTHPKSC